MAAQNMEQLQMHHYNELIDYTWPTFMYRSYLVDHH